MKRFRERVELMQDVFGDIPDEDLATVARTFARTSRKDSMNIVDIYFQNDGGNPKRNKLFGYWLLSLTTDWMWIWIKWFRIKTYAFAKY